MSRADLDQIQAQLKVAIQNHQILVARMKQDPQNAAIQKQLHDVQTQIRALSEKQKTIVQQLKEIVTKQNEMKKPASVASNTEMRTPGSLPNNNNNEAAKPLNQPAKAAVAKTFQTVPDKQEKLQSVSPSNAENISQSPIKVPTFHAHGRPSILSGGRQMTMRSQLPSAPLATPKKEDVPSLSNSVSSLKRSVLSDRTRDLNPADREKHEYMACLDLITPDMLKDLQSRRSERKRRSTANPQFAYGNYELERRRPVNYLINMTPRPKRPATAKPAPSLPASPQQPRKRGRPPKRRGPNAGKSFPVLGSLPSTPTKRSPSLSNHSVPGTPTECSSPSISESRSAAHIRPETPCRSAASSVTSGSPRPSTPSTRPAASPESAFQPITRKKVEMDQTDGASADLVRSSFMVA